MQNKILVTGGAGFIGSAVVRHIINESEDIVLNVDKLTYAGNLQSLSSVSDNPRYSFIQADIADREKMLDILLNFQPNFIMNLAAETHVDRSIDSAGEFIQTNIIGTYNLLEAARFYFADLSLSERARFRFHHISTDEVFGDLAGTNALFTEESNYAPSSPYSASKAASDHLVNAWARTYDLPTIITNCSNNYGYYHFPEKLIPHMILNALAGKKLPVYGDGKQIRDWLFVEDHARALYLVVQEAAAGARYNIGGFSEKTNLEVVETICDLLEELAPEKPDNVNKYRDLIEFVKDRPGHDRRYAIDASKISQELHWHPEETFETGIRKTIMWYLENRDWWQNILNGSYRLERIGNL